MIASTVVVKENNSWLWTGSWFPDLLIILSILCVIAGLVFVIFWGINGGFKKIMKFIKPAPAPAAGAGAGTPPAPRPPINKLATAMMLFRAALVMFAFAIAIVIVTKVVSFTREVTASTPAPAITPAAPTEVKQQTVAQTVIEKVKETTAEIKRELNPPPTIPPLPAPPQGARLGLVDQGEILNRISSAFDIPFEDLDAILIGTEPTKRIGAPFAKEMFKVYGIVLPEDMDNVPRTHNDIKQSHIPNGLVIQVRLQKKKWSREIANEGWITTWTAPNGYSNKLEYVFDKGTDFEKRTATDPQGRIRKVNADGKFGQFLTEAFGGVSKVQARLPAYYPLPQGVTEVPFTLTRYRK